MQPKTSNQPDRALARVCLNCPICRRARKQQRGMAYWLTSKVESRFCPFCRAYERVYGRQAHQPTTKVQGQHG